MNKKDKKILASLMKNSRNSWSAIGREVGLSRENVHYKVQRLRSTSIKDFVTEINVLALGYHQYTCFLQLQKLSKEAEKRIVKYLLKSDSISWVGTLGGKWSLTCDIFARNEDEADNIMVDIIRECGEQYGGHSLLTVADGQYFFEKLLGERGVHNPSAVPDTLLDSMDYKILQLLNENSRITYAELSSKLDLTANAIKNRIRKLEEDGVIVRYTISLDQRKLGFDWHGVQIKLSTPSREYENKLVSFFREHPRVTFAYQYTRRGTHEFDVGVATSNHHELKQFIDRLREDFAGMVEIENTFVVLDELCSHRLPNKVFT